MVCGGGVDCLGLKRSGQDSHCRCLCCFACVMQQEVQKLKALNESNTGSNSKHSIHVAKVVDGLNLAALLSHLPWQCNRLT